jgi:serine/threonine protein phosphatase PrpC
MLANCSGIDLYFSGSTCVTVLIVGNKIFCANVGDSRAVLARECENG